MRNGTDAGAEGFWNPALFPLPQNSPSKQYKQRILAPLRVACGRGVDRLRHKDAMSLTLAYTVMPTLTNFTRLAMQDHEIMSTFHMSQGVTASTSLSHVKDFVH